MNISPLQAGTTGFTLGAMLALGIALLGDISQGQSDAMRFNVARDCMNRFEAHFEEFHPDEWAQAKALSPPTGAEGKTE